MNIQPITYNDVTMGKAPKKPNPRSWTSRIKQKIVDAVPSATFSDSKKTIKNWIRFDERMSKPAENRGVMGATAIILQPSIDASNKRVDDETRHVSICRTIAKIIAGTGVGIVVRSAAYKAVENMTNPDSNAKYSKTLLSKKYEPELVKTVKFMKNYRSALSTGVAIAVMCVTNFLIDAPLTVLLTNYLTKVTMLKSPKEVRDEKHA